MHTDPQYANKLIDLIEYNDLERFDRGEMATRRAGGECDR